VLRQVSQEIAPEMILSGEFQAFLQAMRETLAEAGGAGLAAPQVFVAWRVFLACVQPPEEGEPFAIEVFINPHISVISAVRHSDWEGCLSFLELQVRVPRHEQVRVEYLNAQGEKKTLDLAGFPARVVQHEYDHLDGILTIDRAASTRDIIKTSELEDVRGMREIRVEGVLPSPWTTPEKKRETTKSKLSPNQLRIQ
jgi:peptide deformylase